MLLSRKEDLMELIKLKQEQIKLAKKIMLEDGFSDISLIGGVDQIYLDERILSHIVVLDAETMEVVDSAHEIQVPKLKYIPGYLSYRESPIIVEAFSKLKQKPDLLFVKGNGIIHPRGIGLASHLGLILDIPTIGVAKKLLLGEESGGTIHIDRKPVGYAFVTREHAKPIYISPGHLISLESTETITRRFCRGQKMPEPLHIAHKLGVKLKKPFKKELDQDSKA